MREIWAELFQLRTCAMLIEAAGCLLIVAACARAFATLILTRDRRRAQRLVAEGALGALGFMVCATLLKTLVLTSWAQIGLFASVLALRTALKWAFQSELRPDATPVRGARASRADSA
ncbi:MAG: DUF1622 domain-containing protein [Verrucomicrobiota bacterium]|nr:DUF1622 domain-containing protein [Verrucomicrobiota bacterium]